MRVTAAKDLQVDHCFRPVMSCFETNQTRTTRLNDHLQSRQHAEVTLHQRKSQFPNQIVLHFRRAEGCRI